jgi:hypothetical protein
VVVEVVVEVEEVEEVEEVVITLRVVLVWKLVYKNVEKM